MGVEASFYASGVGMIADTNMAGDGASRLFVDLYRERIGRVDADDGDNARARSPPAPGPGRRT